MCAIPIGRLPHGIVGLPYGERHSIGIGKLVLKVAVDQVAVKRVIPSTDLINLGSEVQYARQVGCVWFIISSGSHDCQWPSGVVGGDVELKTMTGKPVGNTGKSNWSQDGRPCLGIGRQR